MDNTQLLIIVGANLALIASCLGITISMFIHSDNKTDKLITEIRNDTNKLITEIRSDVAAIHEEMKDFHGRLCAIEERNKK